MDSVKKYVSEDSPLKLSFPNNYFDFVIALGVVYTYALPNAVKVLREISRVSKGRSFVTLAAYQTEEEYFLFKDWTLLGTLIFRPEEWLEIMQEADYDGDYWFTGAQFLNLKRKKTE